MPELRAKVRFNDAGTLCYIEPLLQSRFGIRRRKGIGQCLISQVVFTIAAKTSLKPSLLANHIWQFLDGGDLSGFTLEEVLAPFDGIPVITKRGPIWINVSIHRLNDLQTVVDEITLGHPIIVLLDRDTCGAIEAEAAFYGDGTVMAVPMRGFISGYTHTYLAMGVDSDGFLIFRDSRSCYNFNGFLRVSTSLIQLYWDNLIFLQLGVNT